MITAPPPSSGRSAPMEDTDEADAVQKQPEQFKVPATKLLALRRQ